MTGVIGLVANHSHSLPAQAAEQEIASQVGGQALGMLATHEVAAAWSAIKVPQYWTLWMTLCCVVVLLSPPSS